MSLLSIQNLKLEYPSKNGWFSAVDGVSLELEPGEILGLVGESGAGKSTVGKSIIGLIDEPGRVSEGKMLYQGAAYEMADRNAISSLRGREISMIFQDPLTSLNPLFTIEQQLVETIVLHQGISTSSAREVALSLMDEVGIANADERLHQYPHQFSGGMRQRVVIALALCSNPSIIIADEPTTALDVSIQAKILRLIKGMAGKHQVGIILVTHDMGVISEVTDRVAVMYRGRIMELGKTEEVLMRPQHDYTKSLIDVVPNANRKLDRLPEVHYIEQAPKHSAFEDLGAHWIGEELYDDRKECLDQPILSLTDLTVEFVSRPSIFPSRRKVFRAVSELNLSVAEGEVVGLVGESGSGKSTVARALAGIYQPASGEIRYKGLSVDKHLTGRERQQVRTEIQMIFQDPYSSINPRMRALDIVSEPIRHFRLADDTREARNIAIDLLEMVGIDAQSVNKFPHEFSGGQRQRICIARALASRSRFLICDEPTSALDVSIQAQILNLLKDLQSTLRLSMLFISHDLPVVRQMSDRIVVMRDGAVCEIADADQLFDHPNHSYTKELLNLMPKLKVPKENETEVGCQHV